MQTKYGFLIPNDIMNDKNLNATQKFIFAWMKDRADANDKFYTCIRELMNLTSLSKASVKRQLHDLREKYYIKSAIHYDAKTGYANSLEVTLLR